MARRLAGFHKIILLMLAGWLSMLPALPVQAGTIPAPAAVTRHPAVHAVLRQPAAPATTAVPATPVAPVLQASLTTQVVIRETFEGPFPGAGWQTRDGNGATGGTVTWGVEDWNAYNGARSAWAAGGWTGHSAVDSSYPENMDSWLVYGPFSLQNASGAELLFLYWNQTDTTEDSFSWLASTDGENFYGEAAPATTRWTPARFDLTQVPTLGDITGEAHVYIAFRFVSDSSPNDLKGALIDDVVLEAFSGPDLAPYTPSGWSSSVVPSNTTGTTTPPARLYTDQTTYIDFAYRNNGPEDITGPFTVCLDLTNNEGTDLLGCWEDDGLASGEVFTRLDWPIPFTPKYGDYMVRMRLDVNHDADETNESNNTASSSPREWNRPTLLPDLIPFASKENEQTGLWEFPVVPSSVTGSYQAGPLYTGQPTYVDWMVLNNSSEPATSGFEVCLYLDTDELKCWSRDPILALQTFYDFDEAHLITTPGEHRLRLVVDVDNAIAESNEDNNTWERFFTWQPSECGPFLAPDRQAESEGPGRMMAMDDPAPGWTTLLYEDFEGAFPSSSAWQIHDANPDGCEQVWGKDNARAFDGSYAAWPAAAGADGIAASTSKYPPEAASWMTVGPFDLSKTVDARLTFALWRELEQERDYLFVGAGTQRSTQEADYTGLRYSGSGNWAQKTVDLRPWVGEQEVYIAFFFASDASLERAGAWIDNIRVEQFGGDDCSNGLLPAAQNAQQLRAAVAAEPLPRPNLSLGRNAIYLQSRQFVPEPGLDPTLRRGSTAGNRHVLVQFTRIPSDAQRAALEGLGVRLLHYLPERAWIASVPAAKISELAQAEGVRWVGALLPGDRIAPQLATAAAQPYRASSTPMPLMVSFTADTALDAAAQQVTAAGGTVQRRVEAIHALLITLPGDRLETLALADSVLWIDLPPAGYEPLTNCLRRRIGADTLQTAPYNLDGTGINIMLYDEGRVDPTHPAFAGRLVAGDSSPVSGHATGVAGVAGGSGASSPPGLDLRGVAPGARLLSYGMQTTAPDPFLNSIPSDLAADVRAAQTSHNADILTGTVGASIVTRSPETRDCSMLGTYGLADQLLDSIVRGSPTADPLITIWSAGNERNANRTCYPNGDTTGYRTIPPPGAAKNPIHVGATNTDTDLIYDFSSFGPTDDGRIKPTIVAPGCELLGDQGILTANADPLNRYLVRCGTSIAAPAVSGIAALMLQQYRQTYQTTENLLPSTIKAILIHTALDRGRPGPDFQYGYGRVDGVGAVETIRQGDFLENVLLRQDQVHEHTVIVSSGASELRVTLAWDDVPGTPSAAKTLVNDLDLTLYNPLTETEYMPLILSTAPGQEQQPAAPGTDSLNNQEQVIIANPQPGMWLVRVKATVLPTGQQPYSLVYDDAGSMSPVPWIAEITPEKFIEKATGVELVLRGAGFTPASSVLWNGTPLPDEAVTYVSWEELQLSVPFETASVPDADSLLEVDIVVSNPAPGGGESNVKTIQILQNYPQYLPLIFRRIPAR